MKNKGKVIDRLCKCCKHECKRAWKLGDVSKVAADCIYKNCMPGRGVKVD